MWYLHDDSTGKMLKKALGEKAIKLAYEMAIDSGEVLEMNAYIEDEEGNQYALNKNVSPARWDEL